MSSIRLKCVVSLELGASKVQSDGRALVARDCCGTTSLLERVAAKQTMSLLGILARLDETGLPGSLLVAKGGLAHQDRLLGATEARAGLSDEQGQDALTVLDGEG